MMPNEGISTEAAPADRVGTPRAACDNHDVSDATTNGIRVQVVTRFLPERSSPRRREFFFATPAEVRDLLMKKVGGLLEFNETPEAPEYYQSRSRWPDRPSAT